MTHEFAKQMFGDKRSIATNKRPRTGRKTGIKMYSYSRTTLETTRGGEKID